jgi:hypothetical protein
MEFNEFDSRVQGIHHPLGGQRPKVNVYKILGEDVEQIFCLSCGKPGGYISASLPKGLEANFVIFLCPDCEAKSGPLPLPQINLQEI